MEHKFSARPGRVEPTYHQMENVIANGRAVLHSGMQFHVAERTVTVNPRATAALLRFHDEPEPKETR